ncbi:MAG: class I SAM-dependent methyltransferase [Solirubrobacteraceae bacterium]
MVQRTRRLAEASAEGFANLTGLRASPYVAELLGEDLASFTRYLLSPSARRSERAQAASAHGTDECFAFAQAHFGVGPVQHTAEIKGLLDLARENGARVVCEIGTRDGGTSVLFSRVLAPDTLIVMDLYAKNRWRLRSVAPAGQSVRVIDGDSTHPRTVSRLRRKLEGRPLDLLLIDGDHSWSGVRQDFINYREFVRDGGLIAFHDICPVTDADLGRFTGDVPAFWKLISTMYSSREFVAAPGQQGLGIGVIRYRRDRPIAPVLAAPTPPE